MGSFLIWLVTMAIQVITLLVIFKVILSYFMSPYHPIREGVDRVVEPMLAPIRRAIPSVGMIDFSPLILIVLLQILGRILISLFASIF